MDLSSLFNFLLVLTIGVFFIYSQYRLNTERKSKYSIAALVFSVLTSLSLMCLYCELYLQMIHGHVNDLLDITLYSFAACCIANTLGWRTIVVRKALPTKTCPSCAEPITETFRFCSECGHKLMHDAQPNAK